MPGQENNDGQWTEFRMNVPWGHISGKWWGSHDVRPILLMHGWQDNSGTFDTLIPVLPKHLSYLAIDLPGHGFSSHFPAGVVCHKIDYVNVILRIVEAMKWGTVSLIGHSLGGYAVLWFAAMFPQKVNLVVLLDVLKAPNLGPDSFWKMYSGMISGTLAIEERYPKGTEPPSYTYEECFDRFYAGTKRFIDKDKCSYILARNLKESIKNPGTFYFARDPRLRMLNNGLLVLPLDYYEVLAKNVRMPVIYFNAILFSPADKDEFEGKLSLLRKNPLFEYVAVSGRHHVHLNEPAKISDILSRFLIENANTSTRTSDANNKAKL